MRGHWRVHIDHKEGCKPEYVSCKYCFLRLKHGSSTGGLSRHLDKCSAAPAEARSLRSSLVDSKQTTLKLTLARPATSAQLSLR